MEFITLADIDDNILHCRASDIDYANSCLLTKALAYGLRGDEIRMPCSARVRQLGTAIACRMCAASMVGSDSTVMMNGQRSDDVYLQKYRIYDELVKSLSSSLDFSDFAAENVESAGKGGVGMIRLYRA